MKNFKVIKLFMIVILLSLILSLSLSAQSKEGYDIHFNYSFFYLDHDAELQAIAPHDDLVKLGHGSQFKILLHSRSDIYYYIYHISPQGSIELVFPLQLKGEKTALQLNQTLYIPPGSPDIGDKNSKWFTLDTFSGIEYYYLFASSERLNKLEKLTEKYYKIRETEKNPGKWNIKLIESVIETYSDINQKQIKGLIDNDNPFLIEKPDRILISGKIKGKHLETTTVQTRSIYAKRIQIEH